MITLRTRGLLLLAAIVLFGSASNVLAQGSCTTTKTVGEEWLRQREQKAAVIYPEESLKNHVGGRAVVEILVDQTGSVTKVKLEHAPDRPTGEAVINAAGKWKFKPAKLEKQTCYASTLSFQFSVLKGKVSAAPDKYYHDRCRSAFDANAEFKAAADSATPLLMVAFGDSIMWGQGLKERDKFWCRTKQWLELKTRRHWQAKVYAHAGAVIDQASVRPDDVENILKISPQGQEVNLAFPTINTQVNDAVDQLDGGKVNLVLVDGCINDANFRELLDTNKSVPRIRKLTEDRCRKPMLELLTRIGREFQKASVLVTGYYPLIYSGVEDEESGRRVTKGSSNISSLLIEGLTGQKISEECKKQLSLCLEQRSQAWYETSNGSLREAVKEVTTSIGPRFYFAEMNYPPEYAFSTNQSLLWNLRAGKTNAGTVLKALIAALDLFRTLDTTDDRWDLRRGQCEEAAQAFRERQKRSDPPPTGSVNLFLWKLVCQRGSLAHPNRFGAALYAQAITGRLEVILPETGWAKFQSEK